MIHDICVSDLIGFGQLSKLRFGIWVVWVCVWVMLLCQLKKYGETFRNIALLFYHLFPAIAGRS